MLYEKILVNLLAFLLAYFIGSISWSILLSKKTEKGDVRKLGSGNAGATNIVRNFEMAFGLLILLLDILKVVISGMIVWAIARWATGQVFSYLIVQVACMGAFVGHLYPIYYKFKGGKGVSVFYGFVLLYNPLIFVLIYGMSYLIYKKWKYVSLGSVIAPTVAFLLAWIPWMNSGPLEYFMTPLPFWVNPLILLVIDIVIVVKHIPNIKRLINHTENTIK